MTLCSVENLNFSYGSRSVLKDVSLTLKPGRIYGLLGPNGAGKTTLLDLVFGNQTPTGGAVVWQIKEEERFYVRQYITVPNELYIREFVEIIYRINTGRFSAETLIEELPDVWRAKMAELFERRVSAVSFGERKWVITVIALSLRKPIVALDEPTAAMDVPTRDSVWEQLLQARDSGRAFLISSHYLEEFQGTVDGIVAIKNGRADVFDSVDAFCTNAGSQASSMNDAFTAYYQNTSYKT